MSRRSRKRKVRITLSPNDNTDPKRIFDAVEHAFHPHEIEVQVGDTASTPPQTIPPTLTIPNEQLETETREQVKAHLEAKKQNIEAERVKRGQSPNQRSPAPPPKVVETRHRLKEWMKKAARAGWVIVKVAAEVFS